VHLYRDHPPPEPSPYAWQATLAGIADHATRSVRRTGSPWPWRLLMALTASAALIGGILLARGLWNERVVYPPAPEIVDVPPGPDDGDEPFPVAAPSEVHFISIDAEDADRIMMGVRLMGDFEVAGPDDIEIVKMEPHEDGQMPWLQRGGEVPMILASAEREEP
jgi:hypothetical protein